MGRSSKTARIKKERSSGNDTTGDETEPVLSTNLSLVSPFVPPVRSGKLLVATSLVVKRIVNATVKDNSIVLGFVVLGCQKTAIAEPLLLPCFPDSVDVVLFQDQMLDEYDTSCYHRGNLRHQAAQLLDG